MYVLGTFPEPVPADKFEFLKQAFSERGGIGKVKNVLKRVEHWMGCARSFSKLSERMAFRSGMKCSDLFSCQPAK